MLGNDTDAQGDALTANLVANVTHGTLALNAHGGFLYTPTAGYHGPDGFTYRANDGTANSNVATASINVSQTALPTVSIAATTANASEAGPVNGLFTFTRSGGNTAAPLTVTYVITGTASNGNDYASISTTISIPAAQTSVTLPINVFKDNVVEPSETVILTIASSASLHHWRGYGDRDHCR